MALQANNKYYTILTKVGQAKIANAIAYGRVLKLTHFALGDGSGSSYDPEENQTALKHEVYRANVSNVVVSDEAINMMEVNMAVPPDQGGWVVREMGIFDTDGDLIAISKTPDDPKPAAGSGAAKDVVYRVFIIVTNTSAVEIKIDPTVAVATKAEVQAVKEQLQDQINTLAKVVNNVQNYTAFTDIDPTYSKDTSLQEVITTMQDNSILRTIVSANEADYPANGLLEVIKQKETNVACTINATDGLYTLTITAENIEQIFGGGALNKWFKTALGADLEVVTSEIDTLAENVNAIPTTLRTVIKETINTTVDTETFTPINEQIAYQTNILENVFEKELLAIMGFGDGSDGEILTSQTVTVTDQQLPAKIQATNVNLASGQTITVSKACAGLYIYSQGDIVINGSIVMTNLGYDSSVALDTITVKGAGYKLANGGRSGDSLASGAGGEAEASHCPVDEQTWHTNKDIGGNGYAGQKGVNGNWCIGGRGVFTKGGSGAYASAKTDGSSSYATRGQQLASKGIAAETPAGTIVLIAKGKIRINGTIISKGRDYSGSNRGGGASANSSSGSCYCSGGNGGNSFASGFGGGAVTLIASAIFIAGTINVNGGTGNPSAVKGTNGSGANVSSGRAMASANIGGQGGYGANAGVAGEIKQYLI